MKETLVAQEEKEEEEVGIYTPFPFPLKNMLCLARKICTILIMRKTWEKSKSNELLTKNLKRKVGGISIRLLLAYCNKNIFFGNMVIKLSNSVGIHFEKHDIL